MTIERILGTDTGKEAFQKTDRNIVLLEELNNTLDAEVIAHKAENVTQAHGLDYETGVWAPAIYGSTTAGTYVLSGVIGNYTKIGDLMSVDFNFTISSVTIAGEGQLRISGLPISKVAGTRPSGQIILAFVDISDTSKSLALSFVSDGISDALIIQQVQDTANLIVLPVTSALAGRTFYGSIVYKS